MSEVRGPVVGVSRSTRFNGVDRLLAHVEMGRPDLCFYAALVSMAGAVLASPDWTVWEVSGAGLSTVSGWFAAMYGGDYFDRELDSIGKSHRPVPSGRVRPSEALGGMIVWVVLGATIAYILDPVGLVLVVLALVLGVLYAKVFKARGIWGNLFRGGISMCAFAVGVFATADAPAWSVLVPVALVFFLHDASSNVVGALCDAQDDRTGGYLTFPVRHGQRVSLRLMVLLHAAWILLLIGYPYLFSAPSFDAMPFAVLGAAAVVMTVASSVMLLRAPDPAPRETGLRSHEVLVVERLLLAGAFISGAAGIVVGLAVVVPALVLTVLSSFYLMRGSYEPSRRWQSKRAIRAQGTTR